MSITTSVASTGLYAAAVLCFFLPFLNLKCNDAVMAEVSGMELVTGTSVDGITEEPDDASEEADGADSVSSHIDRNYFAVAALILALCGIVLSVTLIARSSGDGTGREMLLSIIGLAGAMCLWLMKIQLESKLSGEAGGMSRYVIRLEFATGYWLTLVLFVLAAFMNVNAYIQKRREATGSPSAPHPEE
jgi:hypothetical protein